MGKSELPVRKPHVIRGGDLRLLAISNFNRIMKGRQRFKVAIRDNCVALFVNEYFSIEMLCNYKNDQALNSRLLAAS